MLGVAVENNVNEFFNRIEKKHEKIQYNYIDLIHILTLDTTEFKVMNNINEVIEKYQYKATKYVFNLELKNDGNIKNEICYRSKYRNNDIFYDNMARKIITNYGKYNKGNISIGYIDRNNIIIINFFNLRNMRTFDLVKPQSYVDDGYAVKLMYEKESINNKIFYLDNYHKQHINGYNNSNFNDYSQRILNFKKGIKEDINYFSDKLIYALKDSFLNDELSINKIPDFITCVPSHEPGIISEGLKILANNVSEEFGCKNICGILNRTTKIQKLSYGGSRNIEVHLNSIELVHNDFINKNEVFKDKKVYIIDDVTTTGNSLNACRKIIQYKVFKEPFIRCIALAKTIKY